MARKKSKKNQKTKKRRKKVTEKSSPQAEGGSTMRYNPLGFKCQMCGNCCRGDGQVFVSPDEIAEMAEYLGMTFIDFRIEYLTKYHGRPILKSKFNLDCIFLEDDGSCKVHLVKPNQCEKWPYWPEVINCEQTFHDSQDYCEGLKEFTYEEFSKLKSDSFDV